MNAVPHAPVAQVTVFERAASDDPTDDPFALDMEKILRMGGKLGDQYDVQQVLLPLADLILTLASALALVASLRSVSPEALLASCACVMTLGVSLFRLITRTQFRSFTIAHEGLKLSAGWKHQAEVHHA